mmetsp:Transcript_2655/g.7935  ORF Transcript_2655/g.7935 Transcript_2655/m.7935 type:complete len:271 (-) Transcript_2655:405-1217(-)
MQGGRPHVYKGYPNTHSSEALRCLARGIAKRHRVGAPLPLLATGGRADQRVLGSAHERRRSLARGVGAASWARPPRRRVVKVARGLPRRQPPRARHLALLDERAQPRAERAVLVVLIIVLQQQALAATLIELAAQCQRLQRGEALVDGANTSHSDAPARAELRVGHLWWTMQRALGAGYHRGSGSIRLGAARDRVDGQARVARHENICRVHRVVALLAKRRLIVATKENGRRHAAVRAQRPTAMPCDDRVGRVNHDVAVATKGGVVCGAY